MTYEDAAQHCYFANHNTRVGKLIELYDELEDPDWLRLVGQFWSSCDNIFFLTDFIHEALDRSEFYGAIPDMMTTEEQTALAALPERVKIFRGCYGVNLEGWSYSLRVDVAERFPVLSRYARTGDQPLLLAGYVLKRYIIALKLDREESEIIVQPQFVRNRRVSQIDAPWLRGVEVANEVSEALAHHASLSSLYVV